MFQMGTHCRNGEDEENKGGQNQQFHLVRVFVMVCDFTVFKVRWVAFSLYGATLLSWGKNWRKLMENYLGSFSLSWIGNYLYGDTEGWERPLYKFVKTERECIGVYYQLHPQLCASLGDIPVTYLLPRGSGAAQNLPTMCDSSFFQNRFLGRYLSVTLFVWQRGALWANSRLPTSSCLGLQWKERNVSSECPWNVFARNRDITFRNHCCMPTLLIYALLKVFTLGCVEGEMLG